MEFDLLAVADAPDETMTVENAPFRAAAFLREVPPYPGGFAGRGVVICAGGVRYLTCAWVLINMLRRLGCTLPIKVWYLGEEEADLNWMRLVEPLGVRCVDAREVSRKCPPPPNSHPRLGGWECKAFAILHCAFEEVLLLDADNVPAVDPTFLFDTPEYRATGTIFWPDWTETAADREAWRVFDVAYRHESEQESGQVLIDKRRAWPALCLCDWYNRHSDFYYRFVYGDKDTFRFAWHRAGVPYSMPPRLAYGGLSIRQGDFSGRLVFQHRHDFKWSLQRNRRSSEFQHQEACFGYIRELAARWNPLLHLLRHLNKADWDAMGRWAGHDYRYALVGRRRWPVTVHGLPAGPCRGAEQ
jgi:hypothetical protein